MIRQITVTKRIDEDKILKSLNRESLIDEKKQRTVRSIIRRIKLGKDKSLLEILNEIEGQEFKDQELMVSAKSIRTSVNKIDSKLLANLKEAAKRIRKYHQKQLPKSYFIKEKGITTGLMVRPLERVGIYVPGGQASYPSSLLMNAIPAQIAGVKEIIIATPANREGEVDDLVLAAASILGIKKIYKIGGAQAVAAMAYGTQTVPKVDKITGPGNIYVTLAKKEVIGSVGIDMLAGPSEVAIIATKEAEPKIVASEMLAQAEHGSEAMAVLVTDSDYLIKEVKKQISVLLNNLSRESAKASIKEFGLIVRVNNVLKAAEVANIIGAEHLVVYSKKAKSIVAKINTAGAIFVGRNSAVALGDYAAGTNHTLPTMGNAAFSSPLGVEDFVKKSGYLEVDTQGLEKLAPTVEAIAEAEGLEAHAFSVKVRRKQK